MAGQEAAICVDQPQHGALGGDGGFEAAFGLRLVAAKVGDQRRVVVAQHGIALAVQFIERCERAARIFAAGVAPGGEQHVFDVALPLDRFLAEDRAGLAVIVGDERFHGLGQGGDRVVAVVGQNLGRERIGLVHVAIGESVDQRAFRKFVITRIVAQGFAEKCGGGERVALRMGDDCGEIVARRTGTDFERPRDDEALSSRGFGRARPGGKGGGGEDAQRRGVEKNLPRDAGRRRSALRRFHLHENIQAFVDEEAPRHSARSRKSTCDLA